MLFRLDTTRWSIHRVTYLIAGIFVFGSVLLGFFMHPYWFGFTGFIGFMLISYALTGWCPSAILLTKLGFKE